MGEEDSQDGYIASKIICLSLNEGENNIAPEKIQRTLELAMKNLGPDGEQAEGLVLSRQEAATKNWAVFQQVLKFMGFEKILDFAHGQVTQISVWCKAEDLMRPVKRWGVPYDRSKRSATSKGVGCVVIDYQGLTLVFGSVHLDGNLVDEDRMAPLKTAAEQACDVTGGMVDAIIFFGDINYTLVPTKAAAESPEEHTRGLSKGLDDLLTYAHGIKKEKEVIPIPEDLKQAFYKSLGDPNLRTECMLLDGCLSTIEVPQDIQVSDLEIVAMPPGSFPTYRLCTGNKAAREALTASGAGTETESLWEMKETIELDEETVKRFYFGGDKGHSGAIKKRGSMCRFNMGWLDRMYLSTRKYTATGDARDEYKVEVESQQGTPLFLQSDDGEALDHTLMSWMLTVMAVAVDD